MKYIAQILSSIVILSFIIIGCKSNLQGYTLERNLKFCDSCQNKTIWVESGVDKSISFESDSILNYSTSYGCLGSTTKLKYHISNDTLIMDKKSLNGIPVDKEFPNKFIYFKDSLINIKTNELYYANQYLEQKIKYKPFYVILDDKVIKLKNRRKAIKFFKKIDPNKEFRVVNRDSAKIQFGIDIRFVTFRIIE